MVSVAAGLIVFWMRTYCLESNVDGPENNDGKASITDWSFGLSCAQK